MNTEHQKRRLRTAEAADYLNLSKSTLEKLRLTGRGGPMYAKLGKICVYALDDLEAWAAARLRNNTSEPDRTPENPTQPESRRTPVSSPNPTSNRRRPTDVVGANA